MINTAFVTIALAALVPPAPAPATAFLSNGIGCSGGAIATSSATTPRFNVSLCVTTTTPWCGASVWLERVGASGGTLRINSRVLGVAADPNAAVTFPFVLPAAGAASPLDLGATRLPGGALAPGKKILIATWNITVLGSKPATDYVFRLHSRSMIAADPLGSCGASKGGAGPDRNDPLSLPADVPIAATFTLRKK